MPDQRKRCKATPPVGQCGRFVTCNLNSYDYRRLYMFTMERGTSMAEAIRQLIREAKLEDSDNGME